MKIELERKFGVMRQPNAHGAYLRFLLVLTLLAAIPLGAQAEVSDLWVTSSANEHMEDAVHGYYRSGAWYLFLPAHMQPDALALWFDGADALTLQDGRKLENGRRTDWMAAGGEYTLTYGKKQIKLFVMQSADLPALFATTASGSLEYIHQTKEHEETGSLYMVTPDGKVVYQDELKQIKGRGNATFQYAKKSYQIKLADKTALCGTDKAKTWVLLANQHDNSLLRNQLSFALSNAVGLRFTPDCQPVDLYINGDYLGSYLLCEKVQVAKGRVEIADLEEANEERNAAKPESHEAFGKKYY